MPWEIDPYHSVLEFSVKHLMISTVKGRFNDLHGTINLDTQHLEYSSVTAQIPAASLDTGMPQRDAHLRSSDFFDVTKYPIITFTSTNVKAVGPNRCIVEGNLSLHGITKYISLQTTYTGRSPDPLTEAWRIGLYATTIFDRREFGMTFREDRGAISVIGFETRIDIHIEALQV